MRRTIQILLLVSATSVCFPPLSKAQQVGPGVGADTEDPKRILREADQAIRKIQSLSYEATYQGSGSFSTHSPISTGRVGISKLDADNPLKAKLSVQGDFFPTGSGEVQPFQVAFDGQTIRKIRASEKALIYKAVAGNDPAERNLGFVGIS